MEQPPPISEVPPALPQAPTMSLAGRICNVIPTPGEVFDEVKRTPPSVGNWLVPAMIATLIGCIASYVLFSQPFVEQKIAEMTSKAIDKQMEKAKMSDDQAEKVREMGERYALIWAKIAGYASSPILYLAGAFLWALVFWIVGNNVMKADIPYMKGVEAAGLAQVVTILEGIIRTTLIVLTGNLFAGPGLGLLLSDFDPQNPLHKLLALVDVMSIWSLIVLAIAFARLARVSLLKTSIWVFGLWLAYKGFFIVAGFAAQKAAGQ